jgi:hypothetical protein
MLLYFTVGYTITDNEWHFVAVILSARDKLGTFYIDNIMGYNMDGLVEKTNEMFTVDTGEWIKGKHKKCILNANTSVIVFIADSMSVPIRLGTNRFKQGQSFQGRMSCLQIFPAALSQSQIKLMKDCHVGAKHQIPSCAASSHLIDGKCYFVCQCTIL